MESRKWQVLFVDDDEEICGQIKEFLEGESLDVDGTPITLQVETLSDFSHALDKLQALHIDVLILDVRLVLQDGVEESDAGIHVLEAVKRKCFVPVIFYTGVAHLVRDLENPFIYVIRKTETPQLLETLEEIFASGLPAVNRALIRHLESVQRDYMWDFVVKHWQQYRDTPDRAGLAYLLARRLAATLSGPSIQKFMADLGDTTDVSQTETEVPPMRYYVMPPVEAAPMAGDIYKGTINGKGGYSHELRNELVAELKLI
jgi:CheY-like chemotaxis protein